MMSMSLLAGRTVVKLVRPADVDDADLHLHVNQKLDNDVKCQAFRSDKSVKRYIFFYFSTKAYAWIPKRTISMRQFYPVKTVY